MDDEFDMLVDHGQQLASEACAGELEGADTVVAAACFPGRRFGCRLPGRPSRGQRDGQEEGAWPVAMCWTWSSAIVNRHVVRISPQVSLR